MISIKRIPHLLLTFGILISFASCNTIYFDAPQPSKGKSLKSIPDHFQGQWTNESAYLLINDSSFYFKEVKKDTLVSETHYILSDSVKFKKAKDLYVASVKKGDWWQLFIIKLSDDGEIYFYYPSADLIKMMDHIELIEEHKQGFGTKYYFHGKLRSKDIGSIIEDKSKFMVLRGDSIIM